ncbi:hypothetical protein [Spongiibacter sp.]|uniref:hypothetical protein n=1 Tax=Spongiibacter sp. TaxID=2024860 RepID=UPI003566D59C
MWRLSYAGVRRDGDIVELVVDRGSEIDLNALAELRLWLASSGPRRYALLVTGSLDFSMQFEAQADIGSEPGLCAIAIVRHSRRSDMIFDTIRSLPRKHALRLELFSERERACQWLREQLQGQG